VIVSLAMSAATAFVVMTALVLLSPDPQFRMALTATLPVMLLGPLVNAAQEMNRAQHRVRRYSVLRLCQDVGALSLGTVLAWLTGLGPAAPFVGLACVLAVLAAVEGSRLWRESRSGAFHLTRSRRYAAYGFPLAIALLLNIALDTGDRFLIAWFLGPEAVGSYAAAYGMASKSLGLLCMWATAAGAPMMMAAWEREGPQAVREVSRQVARALMLVAAPAATGLALVAQPLAEVMIGEAMRAATAHIMPWIALSGLMNGFVLYYLSESFQLSRRTGLRAALMAIPAIANVGLNILLLPQVGLIGAAWSMAACYVLALVLLAVVGRRFTPLAWPWLDFARIGGACAAMAIVVLYLPSHGGLAELILKAATGAGAYVIAALAFDAAGARSALQGFLSRRARQA
jgi:O-antigen/teichoic acid export membrane protein